MGNKQSLAAYEIEVRNLNQKYMYTTDNGGDEIVRISEPINPYTQLGIHKGASILGIKNAYKSKATSPSRQIRAMASLAYYIIMSRTKECFRKIDDQHFVITHEDIFLLTAIGYTKRVVEVISQDASIVSMQNEHGHIPLYIAARSGFYDLTRILVAANGCMINHRQVDGSTALHGAAFYGQTEIVKLLLEHGADPTITNKWNHTPSDDAAIENIKVVFATYNDSFISKFQDMLKEKNQPHRCRPIIYGNDVIAKEVILKEDIPEGWKMGWHGTRYCSLESIVQYGIQPSGSVLPDGTSITTREKHYKLGEEHFGVKDWARAIFVSPSLRYAAHEAYAERKFSDKVRWCIVIRVFFDPTVSHKDYDPTTSRKHECLPGEPQAPEYRIPTTNDDDIIVRIDHEDSLGVETFMTSVLVKSVVFIKVAFLDNVGKVKPPIDYESFCCLFS